MKKYDKYVMRAYDSVTRIIQYLENKRDYTDEALSSDENIKLTNAYRIWELCRTLPGFVEHTNTDDVPPFHLDNSGRSEYIKQLMSDYNISASDLIHAIGVKKSYLSTIINAKTKITDPILSSIHYYCENKLKTF